MDPLGPLPKSDPVRGAWSLKKRVNGIVALLPPKTTFQTLSHDLKSCIIEQVNRPSDLKNVCLVSREMHEIAVRYLYHDVSLELGSRKDKIILESFIPSNIGLKHIRKIGLYLANVPGKFNVEEQAALTTGVLLHNLPEDILEEFRCGYTETWCPWRPFSSDNMLLLYRRQKRLKWLETMDMDRPILEKFKKSPYVTHLFENARKLAIYPENRESLNYGRYFIEKMKDKLEELIVHANFKENDDRSSTRSDVSLRESNDTATAPGLLSSTLFGHFMPFESCTPFQNLTSLRLHRISLRHCADTWCKFIDFNKIQSLLVYQCPAADSFLGQLSKANSLPKCLRVLELQHRDNLENEASIALDGLLCLTSGLTILTIDLQNVKTLPGVAGIIRHGKTLERLSVHCSNEAVPNPMLGDMSCDAEEHVFGTEDFDKICSAASKLEQLSCAWPNRSLIRSASEDWVAYETSVSKLRRLVTLQITTWPSNKPSSSLLPRPFYEQLLQGASTRLFDSTANRTPPEDPGPLFMVADPGASDTETEPSNLLPPSKLRLIAFGISDKIYEREESQNQILYLRSSALEAEGKSKIYATPVSWCARKYLESRSEVLDFVLSRETRLPCKGERADMESRFGFVEDDM